MVSDGGVFVGEGLAAQFAVGGTSEDLGSVVAVCAGAAVPPRCCAVAVADDGQAVGVFPLDVYVQGKYVGRVQVLPPLAGYV